jgi:hypothetical protein
LKRLGSLFTAAIVFYAAAMNWMVCERQLAVSSLDRYRAGVSIFLGNELHREQWLGIYRNGKRVGYTGYTIEKVFPVEGVEVQTTMESRMDIELFGRAQTIDLNGNLALDETMKPLRLYMDVAGAAGSFITITGKREEDRFAVEVRRGSLTLFRAELPLVELHLGNGLVPNLPVSGYRVGDIYEVPCFDPLFMGRALARVEVLSKEIKEVDGVQAEVFILETRFRDISARSWVTPGGELMRQEFGPPLDDLVLRRESRKRPRAERP